MGPGGSGEFRTGRKPASKRNQASRIPVVDSSRVMVRPTQALGLSHAAGHAFLNATADAWLHLKPQRSSLDPSRAMSHFGHRRIPDWFDEAVATLCEFPTIKNIRRSEMRRRLDAHIPLSRLFTMRHPAEQRYDLRGPATKGQAVEARTTDIRTPPDPEVADPQSLLFYAECLTVSEYLAEKAGPLVMGRIGEGLVQGRPMAQLIARLNGLPHSVSELERQWVEWMRQ